MKARNKVEYELEFACQGLSALLPTYNVDESEKGYPVNVLNS